MNPLSQIAALLKATIGLEVGTIGENALRHAVRERMRALGANTAAEYWDRLQNSPDELQGLIEEVVVPETWFFRDSGAFHALASIARAHWLAGQIGRPLRVLSVPCSTGEEPYSIAMTLLDAGFPPERYSIEGIDISERSLAIAREGVYGKNSFRGRDLEFRERHFRTRQDCYEVAAKIRKSARFRQGNLLESAFAAGAEPYDVVFCRNVLIYFDAPTQEQVIVTLHRLLAREGILFVGSAEGFLLRQLGFVPTPHARAFAYQKAPRTPRTSGLLEVPARPRPGRRTTPASSVLPSKPRRATAAATPVPPATPSPKEPESLEAAIQLADTGKLAEAARVCEAHLRRCGPSAAGYYLLGLIHDAMGRERQAYDYYRKTVYLEPGHSDALIHLALLARRRGELEAAHRFQHRARRIQKGNAK